VDPVWWTVGKVDTVWWTVKEEADGETKTYEED